jgi:hypothetical protein
VLVVACLLIATATCAETRFSLVAGLAVPFDELEDRSQASPRVGLRGEWQPVNALGVRSAVSLFVYGAVTDLDLKDDVESLLDARGEDSDSYLYEVGGGLVYSKAAPFFLQAGAAYVGYEPGGDTDSESGFDVHGGAGFRVPLWLFLAEVDATLHQVFLEDFDFQLLAASVAVALPF